MMDGNPVQDQTCRGTPGEAVDRGGGAGRGGEHVLLVGVLAVPAGAAEAPVGLGTAGSYSVLGGQTVTNTGPSKLSGDLGVSPGTAITGFPPGTVGGAKHAGDAQAAKAQSDLTIAYNDAAGRALTASVAGDLVGKTLTAGVYKSTGPLALSGTVTLNGQGNPDAVFIFQVASTLITGLGQPRQGHQRRPGLPRVLAGRQLRDAGHDVLVQGHDHGVDVDRGADRRAGAGPRAGPQRCGHFG
jgi:hypothetical protein